MRPSRRKSLGKGFTLIEAAIAVIIIGLGVTALMAVSGSCTRVASGSTRLSHAIFLAQAIREWTLSLPFVDPDELETYDPPGPNLSDPQGSADDLDDLMDATFDPPVDGVGQVLAGYPGWSQNVSLAWVHPVDLSPMQPGTSNAVAVEATINFHGQPVFNAGWLVMRR